MNDYSRAAFLDGNLVSRDEELVLAKAPIAFLPHYVKTLWHNNTNLISLVGITPSGEKSSVTLVNIPIYFDVFCSERITSSRPIVCVQDPTKQELASIRSKDSAIDKFCKAVDLFKTTHGLNRGKYIVSKVYNAGLVKYPNMLGYRFDFLLDSVRRAAIIPFSLHKIRILLMNIFLQFIPATTTILD